MRPERRGSEVKRAESDSEPSSSPVLRSDPVKIGDGEGPGAERRGAPPGPGLPCLSETTASAEEKPRLPGTLPKQMEAFSQNTRFLCALRGPEYVGALTLTCGDYNARGKFVKVKDRGEFQRRLHSLQNAMTEHFQAGVTCRERHQDGCLHAHVEVLCYEDIRGSINWDACFPPKGKNGKPVRAPCYDTANAALKAHWRWFRENAPKYGFGRCQLQPVKGTGEAAGFYNAKYLVKDHCNRSPEDKGSRRLSYWGHWSSSPRKAGERRMKPPWGCRFGWNKESQGGQLWREMVRQTVEVLNLDGNAITEENIAELVGPKWAFRFWNLFPAVVFREDEEGMAPALVDAIQRHNSEVVARQLAFYGATRSPMWLHVSDVTLEGVRHSKKVLSGKRQAELEREAEWRRVLEQDDFWKGGGQNGIMANYKRRSARPAPDRLSAVE